MAKLNFQNHFSTVSSPYGGVFFLILCVFMLMEFSAPASAMPRNQIKKMVVEEAIQAGVSPSLALAVAKVESDFQSRALSQKGARGVMQIMPATAIGEYDIRPEELWNARLNIQIGVDFLRNLIDRYNGRWDLALSHYNGGSVSHKFS